MPYHAPCPKVFRSEVAPPIIVVGGDAGFGFRLFKASLNCLNFLIGEPIAKPEKLTIDNGQWTIVDAAKAATLVILQPTWASCPIGFAPIFRGFEITSGGYNFFNFSLDTPPKKNQTG
jgi:hypothetical protein